jgi:hypothetical protein
MPDRAIKHIASQKPKLLQTRLKIMEAENRVCQDIAKKLLEEHFK